jgi:YD repeat-containing protein
MKPDFGESLENLVNPGIAYTPEFLQDVIDAEGVRITYTTDNRGRILSETRLDGEDQVISRITNTWSGDRLRSVHLESENADRLTEYEYDGEGNRIMERNLNRGVLERTVRREGEEDVEELYMDGRVILRAVWEQGRNLSEERVR